MSNGNRLILPKTQSDSSWLDTLTALADPSLDPLFWRPERLGAESAWWQHVPLAHWLVCAAAPRVLVELGTHNGVSYIAFCNAVACAGLGTRCHAVDTWQGDPHTGLYGSDVLGSLRTFHDERFNAFSTLLHCTFDEALGHIEDGSVDLLHIDGMHTYEAVRHDFESWLPKLSIKSVVLFHDINVRRGDFGVWRFWGELRQQYPAFEFLHGYGLGVLAVGNDPPAPIAGLCSLTDPEISTIRARFAQLGERWSVDNSARHLAQDVGLGEQGADSAHVRGLAQDIGQRAASTPRLQRELEAARDALERTSDQVRAASVRITDLEGDLLELKRIAAEQALLRRQSEEQQARLQAECAVQQSRIRGEFEVEKTRLRAELDGIFLSTSWRMIGPARRLASIIPVNLRRYVRYAARIGYWALTPHRTRQRIAYFRACHRDATVARSTPQLFSGTSVGQVNPALFDEGDYLLLNPDVKATGVDPAQHFIRHGQAEGRSGRLPDLSLLANIDRGRETVLVVCHEGSRTGAPILGYNLVLNFINKFNVIALFLGPGPIIEACEAAGAFTLQLTSRNESALSVVIERIVTAVELKFAIANSIEAHNVIQALARHYVPTLVLIHEFSSYVRPPSAFINAAMWSAVIVFSADVTKDNACAQHPELTLIKPAVLAQGRCVLPLQSTLTSNRPRVAELPELRDSLLIIGAGTVQYRKGVDLFIACAAAIRKQSPDLRVRFVWIGDGYAPDTDTSYSVYLSDQISREGLEDHVSFVGAVNDLAPFYAAADIFMLTSRLDPLPNVTIDALYEGLPVVCFEFGNGIAKTLSENELGDVCVATGSDVRDMAQKVIALAVSEALREEVGRRCVRIAENIFDMGRYVSRIEDLAVVAARRTQQEKSDALTIEAADVARLDYFLPNGMQQNSTNAIRTYVRTWASGINRRKLFPGFHPGIYLEKHGTQGVDVDPLADFLRNDQPAGPWTSQLITPAEGLSGSPLRSLRVALHIHAYYPDLLPELMDALMVNRMRPDLLISVPNEAARDQISRNLCNYVEGAVRVSIVPNRGRNLGPLLTEFRDLVSREYDIVGHFHTKKSADLNDPAFAATWRNFLTENLIGGKAPMADIIVAKMAEDPGIGLVFPDEPTIVGWGKNRPFAEAIARKMALGDLPDHVNFPVGAMFWADVRVLNLLFKLNLQWSDYPGEPLPYDGSILHSLERLLPLIAAAAGKKLALTHVPRVTR